MDEPVASYAALCGWCLLLCGGDGRLVHSVAALARFATSLPCVAHEEDCHEPTGRSPPLLMTVFCIAMGTHLTETSLSERRPELGRQRVGGVSWAGGTR